MKRSLLFAFLGVVLLTVVILMIDLSKQGAIDTQLDGTTPGLGGYLTIDELGLRLKLTPDTADVVYRPETAEVAAPGKPQSIEVVTLTSEYLATATAVDPKNACGIDQAGLGTIIKVTGEIAVPHVERSIHGVTYAYTYPQSSCSKNKAVKTRQQVQIEALKQAFAKAEEIPAAGF